MSTEGDEKLVRRCQRCGESYTGSCPKCAIDIRERLKLYDDWDRSDTKSTLEDVEKSLTFMDRCQGLIEALSTRYLDEIEDGDLFKILMHREKPLKEAYELMIRRIEEGYPESFEQDPDGSD
ncbi:MAG: hypothetical protein ACE5QW_09515 [Thermoplasmata archaeon]